MYTIDDLITAIRNPKFITTEINKRYNYWRNDVAYNPSGIDIFEEDWDNLIILDGCRYDEFSRCVDLEGRLENRISRGSTSSEFVLGNFSNKQLHDVVYVTANAYYIRYKEKGVLNAELHDLEFVERDALNGITSRPETVTQVAKRINKQYPNKRLIVHYMQPHSPYLGPVGSEFNWQNGNSLHTTVKNQQISLSDHLAAYRENLELVLHETAELLEEFTGKTIVTADHGEMLGERMHPIPTKFYGHPTGVYVDELVKVPWFITEYESRKEIIPEPPIDQQEYDITEVEKHLKNLGYKV